MSKPKRISFHDTKEQYNEVTGDMETVMVFIPECCREGWDNCPHVAQKQKIKKKNIGM